MKKRYSLLSKRSMLIVLFSVLFSVSSLFFIAQAIMSTDEGNTLVSSAASDHAAFARKTADLVIFSFDRPAQLYALLESTAAYVTGLQSISVIYRASDEPYASAYDQVHASFPAANFVRQGKDPRADFKPLTIHHSFNSVSPYILFAVDDIVVRDHIDIAQCIDAMERVNAYGFFLRLGSNLNYCYACSAGQPVPPLAEVAPQVYAWQFFQGTYDWRYPHTVDMTLYRKADIKEHFSALQYHNPNQLEARWSCLTLSIINRKGVCFAVSKIVNLPLNRVQHEFQNRHTNALSPEELLASWNQGLKIDIKPLHDIINKSAHMDYEPTFVARESAA